MLHIFKLISVPPCQLLLCCEAPVWASWGHIQVALRPPGAAHRALATAPAVHCEAALVELEQGDLSKFTGTSPVTGNVMKLPTV